MKSGSLLGLIKGNLARNQKNVVMSSIGIIVGISAFVFFIGLSEGIKEVVLGRIFLIDQVEVIPPKLGFAAEQLNSLFGSKPANHKLTDDMTETFSNIEGLEGAYPKMKFTFPAFGYGGKKIVGRNIKGEMIADGIEPSLVRHELDESVQFKDLESPSACTDETMCADGMGCEEGQCTPISCSFSRKHDQCPGASYCVADLQQCLLPIPILLNEQILELYNGGLAVALGRGGSSLPKISKGMITGFVFNIELNRSAIMRSRGRSSIKRQVQIVGFSDKAIGLGITLPISYVKRFNAKFTSPEAAERYHSIILKVKDQTHFPQIIEEVRRRGLALAEKTSNAEQAAKILKTIETIFVLVSLIIVGIAAINISQMFFMMIYQRKRELGLLRALGASQFDIQKIILGEAACIGFIGGFFGICAGVGAGMVVDWVAGQLPRFPYKPDTFFIYPSWLWGAALLAAICFCVIGAFFPARIAAHQEPATALTQ